MIIGSVRFGSPYDLLRARTRNTGGLSRAQQADLRLQRNDLAGLLTNAHDLSRSFRNLSRDFSGARLGRGRALSIVQRSRSNLGLSIEESTASLRSSERINAEVQTFSSSTPLFEGGSTAVPTIGGVYNGPDPDTLTFTVTQGGPVGSAAALQIQVTNSADELVDTIDIASHTPKGTTFTLTNGLELSLSNGRIDEADSFDLTVSPAILQSVDPDATFGNSGADPGFETGVSVTPGSFEVNGESIQVKPNDTINTVISAINTSAAGVFATFDTATQTVSIETRNGASAVNVGNDTSGFLAAVKLDTGISSAGGIDERQELLRNVSQFSSVSSGQLSINGTQVAIDPNTDTLEDILSRISAQVPDVEADYAANSGRIRIRSLARGQSLVLDDGGTGFLAAADVATGTHEARQWRRKVVNVSRQRTQDSIHSLGRFLKQIDGSAEGQAGSESRILIGQMKGALTRVFSANEINRPEQDVFDTGLGIVFRFEENSIGVEFDEEEFDRARRNDSGLFVRLLGGKGDEPSLFEAFETPFLSLKKRIDGSLGRIGGLLNRLA